VLYNSFQQTEGLQLVHKPVLRTISFDNINSVKRLGKRHQHIVSMVTAESKDLHFVLIPVFLINTIC